jgi:hypothetical protein
MTHQTLDSAFWLLEDILACSVIVLAILFLWYWAIDYALRIFQLNKLLLQFALERLKQRRAARLGLPDRSA